MGVGVLVADEGDGMVFDDGGGSGGVEESEGSAVLMEVRGRGLRLGGGAGVLSLCMVVVA